MQRATGQIHGLDLLRFFAAALVMLYHLGFLSWATPREFLPADAATFLPFKPLMPFIGTGWVGVQIFFVISGIVIAYTANGSSPLGFLNRRLIRLGPGVWICASITLPILFLEGQGTGTLVHKYLQSIFFVPLVPKVASSYWTLSVEISFYAIIFLMLCWDRFRDIERVALWLGYISAAIWAGYWLRFALPLGALGRAAGLLGDHVSAQIVLAQHACFFAIGLLIWLVSTDGWTPRRAVGCAVFAAACVLELVGETAKSSAWTGVPQGSAVPVGIWLAALAVIAGSIRWNKSLHGLLGGAVPFVRAMGLITYPLYLIHEPVGGIVLVWLLRAGIAPALALAAACAVPVVIAAVVAMLLEPVAQLWTRHALESLERRLPLAFDRYRAPTALALGSD